MIRTPTYSIAVAGLVMAMACSQSPPPEQPPPQPSEAELAMQRRTQDSLDGIRRMAADSVERVRVAELAVRARADSVERVRLAVAAAARDSSEKVAAKTAELSQELKTLVHFDVGASALQADGRDALDRKVLILVANPAVRLQITGATDDRGSDAYNQALGTRRAVAVRRYLVSKGIDLARLDEASSGEGSPIEAGRDEAAWAKNRRAEFVVLNGDVLLAAR